MLWKSPLSPFSQLAKYLLYQSRFPTILVASTFFQLIKLEMLKYIYIYIIHRGATQSAIQKKFSFIDFNDIDLIPDCPVV